MALREYSFPFPRVSVTGNPPEGSERGRCDEAQPQQSLSFDDGGAVTHSPRSLIRPPTFAPLQ